MIILDEPIDVNVLFSSASIDNKNQLMLNKKFCHEHLSKRETEVLTYLLQGYSAKEIGKILKISYRTVESYISTLKLKFSCTNKRALIVLCIKYRIFDLLLRP